MKTQRRSKGDGGLYQRGDGRWVGTVELGWTPDGKRRRKVVTSKTQAGCLVKLRDARNEAAANPDMPTTSLTVDAWLTRWLRDVQAQRLRPRSLDACRSQVVNYLVPAVGKVRLDKLTPAHVARVRDYVVRDLGLSSTTARGAHLTLRQALRDAIRAGLLTRNVAERVDTPRREVSDRTALTAEQARAVLRAADTDPLAARWAMALLYGMRQGEALGLRWDGIDVDAGTIDLAWQVARLSWRHGCGGTCGRKRAAECPGRTFDAPAGFEHHQLEGQICLTRPKTAAGVRVVPIVPMIAAALEHRARAAAGQPNPHGLVFATPDGKPIPQKADHTAWHALLLAADLPPVPLHTARHTAATLLLEAGVDGPTAAAILGHSTVVQTRAYQHVSQAEARRALTAVQAALDGA